MMLIREKVQIAMIFTGIFASVFGLILMSAQDSDDQPERSHVVRFGIWKDGGIPAELQREFAPWVVGIGAGALVAAFFLRERR